MPAPPRTTPGANDKADVSRSELLGPLWVTGCRLYYVGITTGVPQIAADLRYRPSRQSRARSGHPTGHSCRLAVPSKSAESGQERSPHRLQSKNFDASAANIPTSRRVPDNLQTQSVLTLILSNTPGFFRAPISGPAALAPAMPAAARACAPGPRPVKAEMLRSCQGFPAGSPGA